jgi:hypothetical protein
MDLIVLRRRLVSRLPLISETCKIAKNESVNNIEANIYPTFMATGLLTAEPDIHSLSAGQLH